MGSVIWMSVAAIVLLIISLRLDYMRENLGPKRPHEHHMIAETRADFIFCRNVAFWLGLGLLLCAFALLVTRNNVS